MALYTSAQSGLWSAGSTWVGGVKPPSDGNHSIVIETGHVVEYDELGSTYGDDTGNAFFIRGTLRFSRTVSTSLRIRGRMLVRVGGTFNLGTEADPIPAGVTVDVITNNSATMAHQKYGIETEGGVTNWAGFRVWGASKTEDTTLNNDVTSTDTTFNVVDATGWQIGDWLVFEPPTPSNFQNIRARAITGISGNQVTIGANLGATHTLGKRVMNVTRNVRFYGDVGQTWRSFVSINFNQNHSVVNAVELGPCEFRMLAGVFPNYCGLTLGYNQNNTQSFIKRIAGPVFHNIHSISGSTVTSVAGGQGTSGGLRVSSALAANVRLEKIICAAVTFTAQVALLAESASNVVVDEMKSIYHNNHLVSFQGATSITVNGGFLLGGGTMLAGDPYLIQLNNVLLGGCNQLGSNSGSTILTNCPLGTTTGVNASANLWAFQRGRFQQITIRDCLLGGAYEPDMGQTNYLNSNANSTLDFVNKNNDVQQQERYRISGRAVRQNTMTRRSRYAMRFDCRNANVAHRETQSVPATAGQTLRFLGAIRFTAAYGTATPPSVTISGLGITPVSFTAPGVADTWHTFDLQVTNPQAFDGNFTITFSAQTATPGATSQVFFDGLLCSPFCTDARHYGFLFGTTVNQVVNPVIQQTNEATVGAYTGIAIDHGTQTVTLSGSVSIRQLYDFVYWDLCQTANLGRAEYLTSTDGQNFTLTYNLTLSAGATLTGTGEVNMASRTLTLGSGATTQPVVAAQNGTTGQLTVTGLNAHAVYLVNAAQVQQDYRASHTGTYTAFIPPGSTGVWRVVLKKPGSSHQVLDFDVSSGGLFGFAANTPTRLAPDGSNMYQATTNPFCAVSFDGTTQANIDIGNGTATLQGVFDETEVALVTQPGMAWLASGLADVAIFNSGGGDYLFLTTKWRLRRATAGDVNATLQAFVTSSEGIIVDGVNGGVLFLSSDSASAIAAAVWQSPLEGSFTAIEIMRIMSAVLAGRTDITDNTATFRNLQNSKDRVVATMTGSERTTITIDAS